MTYRAAVEFLYSLQLFGASLGLERAFRLAEFAGQPQKKLRFIHVAGTNGKGSTCAMLESVYRASGLRVGLYTSPHLVSFRERMQVDRQLISQRDVARLVTDAQRWLKQFSPDNHPTSFEVMTVMALRYFAEEKCDLVVWETGLGGRLDATNIVMPLASVITNIQFDHEKWLGDSLEEIAREKAGIIKPRVPVVTAADDRAALAVIRETAMQLLAPVHAVTDRDMETARGMPLGLRGEHQRINAALALKVVNILQGALPVTEQAMRAGLRDLQWPGRFQALRRGTRQIILDGAHNPAGANALAATVRAEFPGQPLTLVLGLLEDKDWELFCRIVAPLATRIVLTPVASKRTAPPEKLANDCRLANGTAEIKEAISLQDALQLTGHDPVVLVCGSLYLVGEALELLEAAPAAGERALNEWGAQRR